ncbi:MAG: MAPEG family protein [Alphaproteobacteria bacterium]|nr:MAPEG family protein [Alphaproteobacteria bacterium]
MSEFAASPVFQVWAVCNAILVLNLIGLAAGTAVNRSKEGKGLNEEDKALNAELQVIQVDTGQAARFSRAHRNALENVPMFMVTSLGLVMTEPSVALAGGLIGFFTLVRLGHSFFYVNAMQPMRTASFGLAALTQLAVIGLLCYGVFT